MDKIKSNMHKGNKHFVLGLSFVVFSLIASIVWGLTYAEDATLVTAPTTPLPVVNLVGTVNGNSVTLTWTNTSTNQDKFNISRRANGSSSLLSIALVPGSLTTSYVDNSVTAGNTYDYQVEACLSGTGCSYMTQVSGIVIPSVSNPLVTSDNTTTPNTPVTTPPATTTENPKPLAPTNLTATVDGNKVTLNWTDNSNNEAGFKIYRGPIWTDIGNVNSNVTTFIDSGRPVGTYTYRLNAFNSSYLYSPISNDVTVTVGAVTTTVTPTKTPLPLTTTAPVVPTTTIPKTTTPVVAPTTTTPKITTPVVTTVPTTVAPNTENISDVKIVSTTTEIKTPAPLETPKDIIESVTAVLNIIPVKLPEVKTDLNQTEQVKEQIKQEEIVKQEAVQQEITKLVYQDTNKDGISDYDSKYVYNIDPVKPSPVSTYDGKSVTAGEKILLGFDPGKKELEKVVVEDPTTTKSEVVVATYKVREVALTEKKEVKLKGQAMPNSFITLYIYSTPIMVTVKTDSNGEWQYTLDKELENGNHTVYTATVNNTGNIVAKSVPFTFVKTAEAVTLQDVVPIKGVEAATAVEEPGFLQTKNIFFVIIGAIMMIGVTLILIGLLSKKSTQ